jgi:serine/threonine-protein kinase
VVDARADVYALGVLLFEVLTGQAPPPGAVVSPRSRRPDLPEAVERVIFRAMAQNPEQRFQNVREMRDALEAALQAPVPPPQPAYQQPQPTYTPTPSVSQSVTVERDKGGPNWLAIILGVLMVGALCLGAMLIVPGFLGAEETEQVGPPPTEPPPGVTVIVPTVVLPTQEPPTEPPEQPTEAPEQPTEPPEEPTEPPEQPTDEPPTEGPPGGGLPEVCGSIGLIVGGIGLVGANTFRRRRQTR